MIVSFSWANAEVVYDVDECRIVRATRQVILKEDSVAVLEDSLNTNIDLAGGWDEFVKQFGISCVEI